jgi:hypothetical protein
MMKALDDVELMAVKYTASPAQSGSYRTKSTTSTHSTGNRCGPSARTCRAGLTRSRTTSAHTTTAVTPGHRRQQCARTI